MKLTFKALEAIEAQQIRPAKVKADLKAAHPDVVATQEQSDHRLHLLLSLDFCCLSCALISVLPLVLSFTLVSLVSLFFVCSAL